MPASRRFARCHDAGAKLAVADERYCFAIPAAYGDVAAAPLIGCRTLRRAGKGERLGIYGLAAATHIVTQVARHQGRRIFFALVGAGPAALAATRKGGIVVCGGIQ